MPRAVALDLIEAVLARQRPLDDALLLHPGFPKLEPRDRAFARAMAATTLRRLGQIDAVLAAFLDKPLTGKAKPALDLLRLGACQLLFLKTPPHAAVSTSVDLAQGRGLGPYKHLVNAVLRRVDRQGPALIAAQDAARLNTPDWLWRRWSAAYGEATARAIGEAHLKEAPLDLTARADGALWATRLGAEILPTGSLRIAEPRGLLTELPGFADGAWWVQDAAAALPARLLGDLGGARVIDLCAAPGGKTAALAAAGAQVTAVDRSARRLERLQENLARLHLAAACVVADAGRWRPEAPADAVLLDAPCTATGTIRRHPDIARLKKEEDVAKMAAVQAGLLEAALDMVRPGGLLVYCVCSLEPEEGPAQIDALRTRGAPVEPVPIAPGEIGGLAELLDRDGQLRSLPCHLAERGGMDGFFIARLRRG